MLLGWKALPTLCAISAFVSMAVCIQKPQSAISKLTASSFISPSWKGCTLTNFISLSPPTCRYTVVHLISLLWTMAVQTFTPEVPMCSQHQQWFLQRSIWLLGMQCDDLSVFTVLTRQKVRSRAWPPALQVWCSGAVRAAVNGFLWEPAATVWFLGRFISLCPF